MIVLKEYNVDFYRKERDKIRNKAILCSVVCLFVAISIGLKGFQFKSPQTANNSIVCTK